MTKPLNPTVKKHRFGKAWMHEHVTDHWVQEAKRRGYRSRAAFKLLEIGARDKLFRPGIRAVDLGAAPGSWSQVLAEKLGPRPAIVAIDLLPMDPVRGVTAIVGDFSTAEGLAAVEAALGGAPVDLVVSDMAPNLSGIESADAARMAHLVELAVEFALRHLKPDGALVCKVFHGSGYSQLAKLFKDSFRTVKPIKPKASRDKSAETFLVGIGLKRS